LALSQRMTHVHKLVFRPALIATGLVLAVLSAPQVAQANAERILYSFGGADGNKPAGALIADARGNLYGTTTYGGGVGDPTPCGFGTDGCGTVFKLARGRIKVLHSFGAAGDGVAPTSRLLLDADGNLYGTTDGGGTSFFGTVFKLAADNTYSVLHSFTGGSDGTGPISDLIADASGNLYGTTQAGGTGNCTGGCGTVFKITPDGQKTLLYAFKGGTDGGVLKSGLAIDAQGNLYGTTDLGGANTRGTVFKLTPAGEKTILYSFLGGSDGSHPFTGVVLDAAGNLYGTTFDGGTCGDILKLTPEGVETVLHTFTCGAGDNPVADLILDAEGNLYSTTFDGGSLGSVYKLAPDGTLTTLYSFLGGSDGSLPVAGLFMDARGNLYGTTTSGGASGKGTVFKVTN
jgi:uncharacterized repeat protein (TIGR03803 family)